MDRPRFSAEVLKWKINNEENHSEYSKPVSTKYSCFQKQLLSAVLEYSVKRV